MTEQTVLNTAIPADLKEALIKQAQANGRSLKKELEFILRAYFETKVVTV